MTLKSRLYLARFYRASYIIMILTLAFEINYLASDYASRNPPKELSIYPPIPNPSRFLIPEKYKLTVMSLSARFGIPLDIATRLVYEESRWKEHAVNRNANGSFDHGLAQLNSRYFGRYDWKTNLAKGLAHLAAMYKATGSWEWALVSYNAGLSGAKSPPARSLVYAQTIVSGGL